MESTNAGVSGRRILVIDDRVDSLALTQIILQHLGHEVEVASSGEEGVSRALTFIPDLVLCDLAMPGMDGIEVAKRLRSEPATRNAILIAVTGHDEEEDKARTKEAGFDHHLTKPVQFEVLERLAASNGGGRPH
ncbi:MAG: response regulator [Deltaproteobacteria bacterium]|nr:response regulator [Deltaproteobacteria bacterium]